MLTTGFHRCAHTHAHTHAHTIRNYGKLGIVKYIILTIESLQLRAGETAQWCRLLVALTGDSDFVLSTYMVPHSLL